MASGLVILSIVAYRRGYDRIADVLSGAAITLLVINVSAQF